MKTLYHLAAIIYNTSLSTQHLLEKNKTKISQVCKIYVLYLPRVDNPVVACFAVKISSFVDSFPVKISAVDFTVLNSFVAEAVAVESLVVKCSVVVVTL